MVHPMHIVMFITATSAVMTASRIQHHDNISNGMLMKLIQRLDKQEQEIQALKLENNQLKIEEIQTLKTEVYSVNEENKQLKSEIQNIKLKLDTQTINLTKEKVTTPHHWKHIITKRQVQQGNMVSTGCPQGAQGPPGKDGRDGRDGKDGNDGRDGKDGTQSGLSLDGLKQIVGLLGYQPQLKAMATNSSNSRYIQGPRGIPGRDGKDGAQGPPGPKGEPGSVTADSLKQILEQLGTGKVPQLTGLSVSGGAVYTRWGRTTCAAHSQLLYKGVAAGAFYNKGGGSNYLCLPQQPEWGNYQDGGQDSGSYIHGVEYEMGYANKHIFSTTNSGKQPLLNHDAPCAVCHTQTRPSHIMIPAKKTCPAGWTTEYNGYLVSDHDHYQRTEYVCLDEAPEVMAGAQRGTDGALFYLAESKCGSLPCPPYVDGRELTCVVCTK